ncbi:beta-ketoacyl-ACP synthase III [Porphyromonas levii]|uniref:Beta-ketoacyl-[acyl-carrier-protein] synthase III n=1 Tax=Porphyromonas levii TaxID=28114 RepID=A0A4Y8WQR8_9PORP|nr:beta-ketoacyl-ACP synthase III [Porphyromonas levii]MBR8703703.1 3-oxoacyl-[acyl-carrier-protein] synthase 3 [Porphyromonas levii]MBR8713833.1 3-oxoacyl-[acyl-carrier-protein] synthase 3 [Porphyromonas levii]MBR8715839.1 3-oxoacyl-[acyl-carrier-protein] synthase 3 [Porphyromonas levii]MBR8728380.1 3-oxoacyl-[acyl-carrier-protein] synthase 3 [Porphyromonas levii]MBR8730095.1 3-oxoacyl-[acyl-carrier-protein] synthase 3 [Porphyromonas levii]
MEPNKRSAVITAVGGYVPEDVLSNDEIAQYLDTSDEWITTRVGIKERRVLKVPGAGSSYLGIRAVEDMLSRHNINKSEIDLVLCSSNTPDYQFPTTASIIARECGIDGVPCFDFQAACPGFLYGLQIARGFIESGVYKKVLLISAERMSAITDRTDRATLPLFGDGAGCALLEPTEDGMGIQDVILKNDNHGRDYLILRAGGSANPATEETVKARQHYVYQDGQKVFKSAVVQMGDCSVELMEKNGLTFEDIDWVVPHQANMRIIDATARRMGVSMDKVMVNIDKYGNTSSATIPLCLSEWENRLKKGDNLILTAFGAGFTWGSIWLKWGYDSK